jgi:hypothetical protein
VISQSQQGTQGTQRQQQRSAEADHEFAGDPIHDDEWDRDPTEDEEEDEHESYQDDQDVNEPVYVLHSEYMRVCKERDRYLEALRNITGQSLCRSTVQAVAACWLLPQHTKQYKRGQHAAMPVLQQCDLI